MDQGHVVVAGHDISQCRESFFDALNHHIVGEGVSQMAEFWIGGGVGDEEAASISDGESTHETTAGDGGVDDGDVVA